MHQIMVMESHQSSRALRQSLVRPAAGRGALVSLKVGDSVSGNDGSQWTLTDIAESHRRHGAQNVVREKARPTPYSKRYVRDDVRSSWGLLISESMLKHIQDAPNV